MMAVPGSVFVGVAALCALVACCAAFPFPGDGIVDPGSHYQRFRRSEYPASDPYFQWWYFCAKDTVNGKYFAISYMYSESKNATTSGSFMQVALVDQASQTHFVRVHQMPLSAMHVDGDFNVTLSDPASGSLYTLKVADTKSHKLFLTGYMAANARTFFYDGSSPEYATQAIHFELELTRIYGWFGQPDFEEFTHELFPVIMWNTYTHNAYMEDGSFVQIGNDVKIPFGRQPGHRAYGDMNWGRTFPHSPTFDEKDKHYAWGWYDVVLPSETPGQDIAIIAGSGETWTGVPLLTVIGAFADLRLTDETHVGMRVLKTWNDTFDPLMLSNDEKVYNFDVARSNWVVITDSMGSASVPLNQIVTLETAHHKAVLEFDSKPADYNRLVFPYEDFVFSDFEGLGVHVVVSLFQRTGPSAPWKPTQSFTVENGGLEFGYRVL
jgi:hypothetical protein